MEGSYFKHKARSKKVGTIIGWIFLGIIGVTVFAFLFGYVVMLLWNWLMPELFGLAEIGFWKAVGIILLAKLIFGGFGGGHGKSSEHKKSKRSKEKSFSNGFTKWRHYDKFWKEKGEAAYNEYVKQQSEDQEQTEDAEHTDVTEIESNDEIRSEDDDTKEKTDM